ncbi:hypothetical protein ACR6C2_16920 [Streptomyces sp. INA 01156]
MASVEKLVKDAATDGGGAKPMKTPEELIRDVLRRYGGEAKSSDVLRPLWGKLNAAGIKDAVADMDDVEMIEVRTGKRGAPSIVYRLIDRDGDDDGQAPVGVPDPTP